jgi:hypothetical protein
MSNLSRGTNAASRCTGSRLPLGAGAFHAFELRR